MGGTIIVPRANLVMGLVGHLLVDLPALLLGTLLANRSLDKVGIGLVVRDRASDALKGVRNCGLADPEALALVHL